VKAGSSTQAAIISEESSKWHCGIHRWEGSRADHPLPLAAVDFWSSGIYSMVSIVDKNEVNGAFELFLEKIEVVPMR